MTQALAIPIVFYPKKDYTTLLELGIRDYLSRFFLSFNLAVSGLNINFKSNHKLLMKPTWLQTVFLNFFIAACMGLLLRLIHVIEIPWMDFKNMMHAHSHVAMLGWLFMAFYGLILDRFTSAEEAGKRIHSYLFWAAQLSVVGMMFSFPVQGYGAISIAFTTAHLIIAYTIAVRLLRAIRRSATPSTLLIRTALILMVISTIGVWLLGPIKAGWFGNSVVYYASIQFFLHFQFNGWFTFAALALVFHQIEQSGQHISKQHFRWFFGLLLTSVVLTYALSVAWSTPEEWLFWINGTGVIVQLFALGVFLAIVWKHRQVFLIKGGHLLNTLYALAIISFAIKILIQTAVVIPQVAVMSYTIRQFVVGFIHLTMLGSISLYLLAVLNSHQNNILSNYANNSGLILIALGFVFTEGLLFLQGTFLWMALGFLPLYYELILIASVFIPLGILLFLFGLNQSAKTKMQPHN